MSVSYWKWTWECLILCENFTFPKDKVLKSGETSWRCCQRKLHCKARLCTIGTDNLISRREDAHNHGEFEKEVSRKTISSACKRKAREDISERPSEIICRALSTNLPPSFTTTDVGCIRRNIYNSRCKSRTISFLFGSDRKIRRPIYL